MTSHLGLMLCAAIALAGASTGAAAQALTPTATLTGTVEGPDGSRLPGAVVTVWTAGNVIAQVVAGDQGAYRASGLPAGRHRVRADLQGFRSEETAIDVGDTAVVRLDLRLALDSLTETVTVVGSAERASLEPGRIRESGARDVGEALGALAGVWKVRRGPIASDVVVRGYQGENVTMLIDGMRLYGACPNNMDHTAFHVDFAEVERIEIGKGPFDLRNQGGLGAAVNVVTKRPSAGFHLTPQAAVGSYGYFNPSVTGSYGTRGVAVLAGYSYRVADGYTDGEGRSFLGAANYKAGESGGRAFDVGTAWTRGDVVLGGVHGFQAGYTRQRAGEILYPYLQMDAVYDNADRVNVAYDLKRALGPLQALRAQGYWTRVDHWMTDAKRLTSANMPAGYSMATLAKTSTAGGKAEAALRDGTVGVEVYRRGWDARTQLAMMKYQPQSSVPDVTLTSAGVYAEFSRPLGNGVKVEAGGRVDRTRNAADAALASTLLYTAYHASAATSAVDTYPSGKVRLSYEAHPGLTVSGGLGHTVRVPDPQERFFGLRRAGTDWVGNPLLKPTRNTGLEMNVAYRAGRLFVNGSLHRDALHDAIGVYQQARRLAVAGVTNASARSYRNVDAVMSGAEIEAVFPVTDRLFVAGDVALVRGRQKTNPAAGINSPWLSEMPPARSRLALRYEHRGGRWNGFAEIEGIYSPRQSRVDTDLRESPTPAYGLANARVGGGVGRLRLAVGLANLFDTSYVEHLSYQRDPFRSGARVFEPGRNIYANLSVAF